LKSGIETGKNKALKSSIRHGGIWGKIYKNRKRDPRFRGDDGVGEGAGENNKRYPRFVIFARRKGGVTERGDDGIGRGKKDVVYREAAHG
ncbi:MAG: hypothetical protein WC612_06490, partial [Bdellovibrionales bacterium]